MRSFARVRIVAAAVALGALFAAPQAANAESNGDVVTCPMLVSWSISPGLSTGNTSGTINGTYTGACASAGWFGIPDGFFMGVQEDIYGEQWSNSYGYSGNCLLASMSYYFNDFLITPIIIGGSVVVADSFNPFYEPGLLYEVDVLAPLLAPCLQTGAIGYGQPGFIGQWGG